MIETSSDLPRKSSEIFKHTLKSSETNAPSLAANCADSPNVSRSFFLMLFRSSPWTHHEIYICLTCELEFVKKRRLHRGTHEKILLLFVRSVRLILNAKKNVSVRIR